mgnify:CR=1 FL=1
MGNILTGFLYVYSIFIIVEGVLSVFATDLIKRKFFNKILQISDLKKFSPLAIIAGLLFLMSIPYNRRPLIILLLGILSIIKGITIIVAPEKIDKMRAWFLKASDNVYRAWGAAMIILGSVILMGI